MSDLRRIQNILAQNASKNFVQRILRKNDYPVIQFTNENGETGEKTHVMAYSDDGRGKYFVYPTVVYNPRNKQLVELPGDQAWEHAMQTGEYIEFNNKKDADWFSKNYKKVWD